MKTNINKHGLDGRYTIAMEFNGKPVQQHVVRFCGEYLGGYGSLEEAKDVAFLDFLHRDLANCGYEVLTECEGVVLFKGICGKSFKVVYGADVTDYSSIEQALDAFKYYILHLLQCESRLG